MGSRSGSDLPKLVRTWSGGVVAVTLTLTLLSSGCSSRSAERAENASTAPAARTVTVTDATGEVTMPVTGRGVLALDELMALDLMVLGITPETTIDFFQEGYNSRILAAEGVVPITAGSPGEPDIEALLAIDADLAITQAELLDDHIVTLRRGLAPTLVVDTLDSNFLTYYPTLETVVGSTGRTQELSDALDAAIEDLAIDIADAGLEGRTLSFLTENIPGESFVVPRSSTLNAQVIERVGLVRPSPELEVTGRYDEERSFELLPQHDADYMLMQPDGSGRCPSLDSALRSDEGVGACVPNTLEDPVGVFTLIEDIRRVVLEGKEPLGPESDVDIWNEFVKPR